MKYMDKQALFEVKLAFLLYCISKIPPMSLFWFANSAGGKLFISWLN